MADSYFGAYGSASRKEESEWFCFDWAPCAKCPYGDECCDQCEHWAAVPFGEIGGFLLEPGSSSGLVRFPPGKVVRNMAAAVRENGGLFLVNEVTTGMGRTGLWFGYQHFGISPDIVALGKGIGNGYPVSVTAFAPGVLERLGGEPVKYAQSHQNDPIGAAVAREVVRVIRDEGLIERGQRISAIFLSGLERISERTRSIRSIRGRGLMAAVELEDDADCSFAIRIHREMVDRGYVFARRPGLSVLRIDPSLTIGQEDMEGFLETFEEVLTEAEKPC
jgi:acetylornithine/N-succinyldiaminopimelate aminotransferase